METSVPEIEATGSWASQVKQSQGNWQPAILIFRLLVVDSNVFEHVLTYSFHMFYSPVPGSWAQECKTNAKDNEKALTYVKIRCNTLTSVRIMS